jgi:secreted PhoX family phosphatase
MSFKQVNNPSRRNFLKSSAVVSLGFLGLYNFTSCAPLPASATKANKGYGPLLPDPNGVLNLPKGFSYKIISRKGSKMTDGFFTPGAADGMATFAGPGGRTIIVRNHEVSPATLESSPFGRQNELLHLIDKNKLYDYGRGTYPALGGTTTLVYNHQTQTVEKEFLSLAGTTRNCAGGPTPWNSWITCEETTEKAGEKTEKDHGYNFEVPATDKMGLADPIPLKDMGRFNHEAVAVDPRTSIVYLTEDRPDGLIYRYLPNEPKALAKGGKLQVLAIRGQKSFDTRNWKDLQAPKLPLNKPMEVEWLDIDHVEAPDDDLRYRGFGNGAARFARGEGMWFGNNEFYFACTNGGHLMQGQVFRYIPSENEGQPDEKNKPGSVELFAEPNNSDILKSCDNLTIAPWGDLVLCEDDAHPFVVGITPKGEYYKLAENVGYQSEFAGGVFSPDGSTYFVNIQGPGLTIAITGPWQQQV